MDFICNCSRRPPHRPAPQKRRCGSNCKWVHCSNAKLSHLASGKGLSGGTTGACFLVDSVEIPSLSSWWWSWWWWSCTWSVCFSASSTSCRDGAAAFRFPVCFECGWEGWHLQGKTRLSKFPKTTLHYEGDDDDEYAMLTFLEIRKYAQSCTRKDDEQRRK